MRNNDMIHSKPTCGERTDRLGWLKEIVSTIAAVVLLVAVVCIGVAYFSHLAHSGNGTSDSGTVLGGDVLPSAPADTVPTVPISTEETVGSTAPVDTAPPADAIGEEAAAAMALEFLEMQNRNITEMTCWYEASGVSYCVRFYVDKYRYEVVVHAVDAEILSVNMSIYQAAAFTCLGTDQAIEIALQNGGYKRVDGIFCAHVGAVYCVSYIADGVRYDTHVGDDGDVICGSIGGGPVTDGLHIPLTEEQALQKLLESDVPDPEVLAYVREDLKCRTTVSVAKAGITVVYNVNLYKGDMVYSYTVDLYSGNVSEEYIYPREIATPEQALQVALNYNPRLEPKSTECYQLGTEYNRTLYLLIIHASNTHYFMIDADSLRVLDVWMPFPGDAIDERTAGKKAVSQLEDPDEAEYLLRMKGVFNDGHPFYCIKLCYKDERRFYVIDGYSADVIAEATTYRFIRYPE